MKVKRISKGELEKKKKIVKDARSAGIMGTTVGTGLLAANRLAGKNRVSYKRGRKLSAAVIGLGLGTMALSEVGKRKLEKLEKELEENDSSEK